MGNVSKLVISELVVSEIVITAAGKVFCSTGLYLLEILIVVISPSNY